MDSPSDVTEDGTLSISVHKEFNTGDADVVVQSVDGVQFRLHRKNLEVNTGAFPGSEFATNEEVVHLTEPASVLEILFQFIYCQEHPLLEDTKFELLLAVAEAVEKYQVAAGRNICEIRLRSATPVHAKEIQAHAIKHNRLKLFDETALHLLPLPLSQTMIGLPPNYIAPWHKYYESWTSIFDRAFQEIRSNERDLTDSKCKLYAGSKDDICRDCRYSLLTWAMDLQRIESLVDLKTNLANPLIKWDQTKNSSCPGCRTECVNMGCIHQASIIEGITNGIRTLPPFTKFWEDSRRCLNIVQ